MLEKITGHLQSVIPTSSNSYSNNNNSTSTTKDDKILTTLKVMSIVTTCFATLIGMRLIALYIKPGNYE